MEIEQGRHQGTSAQNRFCKLCLSVQKYYIEDEYHVLMKCPFYKDLRTVYLDFVQSPPNLFSFINIMLSTGNELTRLCSYIAAMFKLRETLTSSL